MQKVCAARGGESPILTACHYPPWGDGKGELGVNLRDNMIKVLNACVERINVKRVGNRRKDGFRQ